MVVNYALRLCRSAKTQMIDVQRNIYYLLEHDSLYSARHKSDLYHAGTHAR
jgi:hypothetical protein